MTTRLRIVLVSAALVALATPTIAQEPAQAPPIDARAARRKAREFLTEGLHAPRPDLGRAVEDALEPIEVEDPTHGPAFDLLLRNGLGQARLIVRVERGEGRVTYFSQPERDSVVLSYDDDRQPRTDAEVDEEARVRAILDRAALRARARQLLGHLVPEVVTGARRFEVVLEESQRGRGLLVDRFVLHEVPADGVLACFRNSVLMDVSPETGDVVSVVRTDLRHEVRAAPPVDAAAATRAARAATDQAPVQEAPRLVVLPHVEADGTRRLVPAWVVVLAPAQGEAAPRLVAVDAQDGRVVAR
ncbi:MAG: hypothetical protein M9894_26825 [Planctomycetes bacterium]|nr:hypothetical protein [Planctomycetota bacterium]